MLARIATILTLIFTASTAVTALGAPARAGDCIDDWSVAAPLVRKEGLVSVEKLDELARSKGHGTLVRTQLCRTQDGYQYRVIVRGRAGALVPLTVDARKPFER
jgi:hypothetical protein